MSRRPEGALDLAGVPTRPSTHQLPPSSMHSLQITARARPHADGRPVRRRCSPRCNSPRLALTLLDTALGRRLCEPAATHLGGRPPHGGAGVGADNPASTHSGTGHARWLRRGSPSLAGVVDSHLAGRDPGPPLGHPRRRGDLVLAFTAALVAQRLGRHAAAAAVAPRQPPGLHDRGSGAGPLSPQCSPRGALQHSHHTPAAAATLLARALARRYRNPPHSCIPALCGVHTTSQLGLRPRRGAVGGLGGAP